MLVPGTPTTYSFIPPIAPLISPSGGWFNVTGASLIVFRIWGGSATEAPVPLNAHELDTFTLVYQNDPSLNTGLSRMALSGLSEVLTRPAAVTGFTPEATEADPWQMVVLPAAGANISYHGMGFWAPYIGIALSIVGPDPNVETVPWYIQGIPFYWNDKVIGSPINF